MDAAHWGGARGTPLSNFNALPIFPIHPDIPILRILMDPDGSCTILHRPSESSTCLTSFPTPSDLERHLDVFHILPFLDVLNNLHHP